MEFLQAVKPLQAWLLTELTALSLTPGYIIIYHDFSVVAPRLTDETLQVLFTTQT